MQGKVLYVACWQSSWLQTNDGGAYMFDILVLCMTFTEGISRKSWLSRPYVSMLDVCSESCRVGAQNRVSIVFLVAEINWSRIGAWYPTPFSISAHHVSRQFSATRATIDTSLCVPHGKTYFIHPASKSKVVTAKISQIQPARILHAYALYVRAINRLRAPEVQSPARKALADIKLSVRGATRHTRTAQRGSVYRKNLNQPCSPKLPYISVNWADYM